MASKSLSFKTVTQAQQFLKSGEAVEDGTPVTVEREQFGEGKYDAKKGFFVFSGTGYISRTQSRAATAAPSVSLTPPPPVQDTPPEKKQEPAPLPIVPPPKAAKPQPKGEVVSVVPPLEFTGDLDMIDQVKRALSPEEFRGFLLGRLVTMVKRFTDRVGDRVPDVVVLRRYVELLIKK